jgi:hypothetical protein
VNGVLTHEIIIPSGMDYQPALLLGMSIGSDYGSRGFLGDLDEAAFYDYAMTADQIRTHYDIGKENLIPDSYRDVILDDKPLGYWRLNAW